MKGILRSDRRSFLKSAGLIAAAGAVSARVAPGNTVPPARDAEPNGPAGWKKPLTPAEFKAALEGPIFSNPTPFKADYEVDHEGLNRMIQRAKGFGVRIFALTAGNSQYGALSYEEIKELTRAQARAAGADAISIAATGDWWTGRAVEYARFAESVGSDALQVMLPSRSGGEDEIVKHFEAIAAKTKLPLVLHGNYSPPLLRRLLKIDSIVAMKEDLELTYYINRQIEFGDRISIFSGGAENRFLVGYPYGSRAFFSTYTTFAPDISMSFWRAIRAGDVKRAASITTKYDYPFISRFSHPFWHATLEYFGAARRYMRPPQQTFTDEQMADVKRFFDGQGLSPDRYQA